jgi:glycosyltransferase involved in cell wall biosynthesis
MPAGPQQAIPDLGRPLRVGHVGQFMMRGGIEMWLKGLVRHATPERLRFVRCVATSDTYADSKVAAELGLPVEIGGRESVRRLAGDCDVLLCSGPAEVAAWLSDIPPKLTVFVSHGTAPPYRALLESCSSIVNHVVAVSSTVREATCANFPCTVIPNGIDVAHIAHSRPRDEVRQGLGFGRDDFVLGYVGRFSWEKRPRTVIEAVAQLPPRFKALLVGWGEDRQELLELANQRIPGRYALAEGDRHIGDYYQALDALCLPSEWEGFGLVVLEAMFAERPVIACSVGCVPDAVVDRVNGVVVSGDPGSFAAAATLLEAHPQWAHGIAREGRRYADQQGHARQMCQRYEELLTRLWLQPRLSV